MSDGPDRPWTDDPNAGGAGQPPAGSPPPSGGNAPGYGAPPPMDPNAAPPADSGGQPPVAHGGPPPAGYGGPPSGAPQVGMPTATAGLGARIGARLLDALIVGLPASIILGLVFRLNTTGWAVSAVVTLLWFGYFVLMESNRGATVGKGLLNLRVVGADGQPPSIEQAAKRNIWMLFGLIPLIGGLIGFVAVIAIIVTISTNAANRGYHDQFAETAVMR